MILASLRCAGASLPVAIAFLLLAPSAASAAPSTPRVADARASGRLAPIVIGTVRDTAGAPISNVQVVVSGLNRTALTDDSGEFVLRGLPAGTYHLDLVRIGYAGEHRIITVPETGDDVRVTIVMRVATVRLSSVNVTATPTGTDPLNVTQATVQLSGKELQRSLSSSVGATLSGEPGMATRYSGPLAAAPVIRGLTGERVLVLQDGERTGDLSSSASDHLNAVDPSSAQRLEVIRGPASLLYGNNALGGVVNVISNDIPTSIPNRLSGFVVGQGETATPGGVGSAGITVPVGRHVALTARGGFRRFDLTRVGGGATQPNTDGETSNLTVGLGTVAPRVSVGAVYRGMDFEYGLPFPADGEGIRLNGSRRMGALQSTVSTGYAPLAAVRVDGTVQSYRHSEIEPGGEVGTRFRLNTQTANLTGRTQFGRVAGAIGVQGLFRQYSPMGEEAFTPPADNDNVAAYVYQEVPIGAFDDDGHSPSLQLGARYDRFSITTRPDAGSAERFGGSRSRTFDNVAASVGVSLPLMHDLALTANVSRGFRAPTVEELFANGMHVAVGTFDVGNPELDAEKSTGFEAGLRAQDERVFAQVTGYYNLIDDYIVPRADGDTVVDEASVPRVRYVGENARLYGVEAQMETKLPYRLVGGLMGDVTRAEYRDGGGNLPYIPAARLGGSLRYDDGKRSAGAELRRTFAQTRTSGDPLDLPTDAYTLVNLSATWLFTVRGGTVHSLTLRADNVLDESYRDATSRIKSFALNPGRNLSVVYRLLF